MIVLIQDSSKFKCQYHETTTHFDNYFTAIKKNDKKKPSDQTFVSSENVQNLKISL